MSVISTTPASPRDHPQWGTGRAAYLFSRTYMFANAIPSFFSSLAVRVRPPNRPPGVPPSIIESIQAVATFSWLNLLLIFVPISWILHFMFAGEKDTIIFIFSFLAIVPLANLYSLATDELSMRVGQATAGLINATLGNVVELIVAIVALIHCELRVVQSSLIGSMLSNLLLVLGMCFIAGGYHYQEQGFSVIASQINSSLLILMVFTFFLIGTFHYSAALTQTTGLLPTDSGVILKISRAIAIILLISYIAYLFFQHKSHVRLFEDNAQNSPRSTTYPKTKRNKKMILPDTKPAQPSPVDMVDAARPDQDSDEEERPQLCISVVVGLLLVITALVAVTSEWLVASIDGMTSSGVISKEFVGLILLPIVGNAAEHASAVTVAIKDKLTLSLAVAAGSSVQIGFFVYPVVILAGWAIGKPLTMVIDVLEFVVLFFAVLACNSVVQDGKSNWLEGIILMNLYVMIAVTFWFYPGSDPTGGILSC